MQVDVNIKLLNKQLAKIIKELKDTVESYYGIESECIHVGDMINYLNEFSEECQIEVNINNN